MGLSLVIAAGIVISGFAVTWLGVELKKAMADLPKQIADYLKGALSQGVVPQGAASQGLATSTEKAKANDKSSAPPKPKRIADPYVTGFLRSVTVSISFDTQDRPPKATITYDTRNIGTRQIMPGAATFAYIRFWPALSAKEEDDKFSTLNLGGGPGGFGTTENNYWEPSDPPKRSSVSGSPEVGGSTPQELFKSINEETDHLADGTTRIYFYARHIFKDKSGVLATESCFFYQGPDFTMHDCHGHNGPGGWPAGRNN